VNDEVDWSSPPDLGTDRFDKRSCLGRAAEAAGDADDPRVLHE
jgi:hypothetical protein